MREHLLTNFIRYTFAIVPMRVPWSTWIPGVLSREQVSDLCKQGYLTQADRDTIDYSSIDLHLDKEAWVLPLGSIKPSGRSYLHFVEQHELARGLPDSNGVYELEPQNTYLFRIRERLGPLRDSGIYGEATAKSSVGRLDVLARLVVDGTSRYEGFSPDELAQSSGEMFIEITPMTFRVRVKQGTSLSQLRLFYGEPAACEIKGRQLWNTVLHHPDCDARPLVADTLSVDLDPTHIGNLEVAAFEAANPAKDLPHVDLWKKPQGERPQPWPYWKFKTADKNQRLQLQQKSFYILRSRERLCLPPGVAAYCRAIDETIGEMRIHYAGFVHPFFGFERTDKQGTPLIFEVRGHDLNVSLIHREKLARLTFYRMSMDAIKTKDSEYSKQELQLSGYFGVWPEALTSTGDGVVVPVAA